MPPDEIGPRLPAITRPEGIQRVERDAPAQEFKQKDQDEQKKKKRSGDSEVDEEIPQDVIELSGEYPSSVLPQAPAVTAPPPESDAPRKGGKPPLEASDSKRHLDIQV